MINIKQKDRTRVKCCVESQGKLLLKTCKKKKKEKFVNQALTLTLNASWTICDTKTKGGLKLIISMNTT